MKSIPDCWPQISRLEQELQQADAIVIGAGSGLSTASGFTYSGQRFASTFSDFMKKYHFQDAYTAGFYEFSCPEEFWAFWSRNIWINRYSQPAGEAYENLLQIVGGRNYFILTTNVDHCFQNAGFSRERLFYTQGDYGLFQCSLPCHQKTYDNREQIEKMVREQKGMRIPSELIPHCPICGRPMALNLRSDETFVEDEGWHQAADRYQNFLHRHIRSHILFLELGVGYNTPGIIKIPFQEMAAASASSVYACINQQDASIPDQIGSRGIGIECDLRLALAKISQDMQR